MLGHQLPQPLPPFPDFWSALDDVFRWLDGTLKVGTLPRASLGALDPTWQIPQAITSWRRGFPLELLRYAGANRLKVDIDYRAENGRQGPRRVEPYSLRRTEDRNLVLFVVNDRRQLHSYRIDRIAGIKPTTQSFTPRTRWNSDPANLAVTRPPEPLPGLPLPKVAEAVARRGNNRPICALAGA